MRVQWEASMTCNNQDAAVHEVNAVIQGMRDKLARDDSFIGDGIEQLPSEVFEKTE